ncbi:hypothetical protein NM688_g4956 [Phlebia brevispora]|uniref:Uncharacterized protein n=1 Tax=Phlebia brevispora TaxID=194682 RepID=A0ACC1T1G8_9APHY|nr:hypothetical protein NM688_g4956 [Phlebia brevispora]
MFPSSSPTTASKSFSANTNPQRANLAMEAYADGILDKHMKELRSDFCTFVQSQTDEYVQRITDLEQQLRESKIVNEYLQRQSHDTFDAVHKLKGELQEREERLKAVERRVVCVIDGDGYIFAFPFLAQGRPGGRLAAQKLAETIRANLSREQCQIHAWVFVNKRGLCDVLRRCNHKDAADGFEAFMWGFNQAAERFLMVDVGDGKEMVDAKVKAYLEDEVKAPQTLKVIFGGCHDNGYLTTISSLITVGYEQKLVLLSGYLDPASGFKSLSLPTLSIPDLFEQEKLTVTPAVPIPATPPGLSNGRARDRSLSGSVPRSPPASYTDAVRNPPSPAKRSAVNDPPRTRHVDPTKPLYKQNPPPCNLFYLTTNCRAGANCVFAHDYILTAENYEEMRQNAKKSPCAAANRVGSFTLQATTASSAMLVAMATSARTRRSATTIRWALASLSEPACTRSRDEALTRLLDLSTATVKRNSDLETRVTELELELSVWKQAHAAVVESAERDKKAHNAQVSTLNRQISSLETIKSQNPLILCVIDGEANIFSPSLLAQGQYGGQQAAQQLTKGIAEYLSQEDVQVFGRLSFWITIYLNRRSLLETLLGNSLCTAEQFEAFLMGFSQASPRFQLVEVGAGKEVVDAKIKEYLHTFTRFPQTLRVFMAGGHDNAYMSTLSSLGKEELLGKLVFLQGYNEPSAELLQLSLPSIRVDGLFLSDKPPQMPRRSGPPGPLALPGVTSTVTTNGGLISPQSETHSITGPPHRPGTAGKPIDPTKPGCKYSHEWALTSEQLEILARNAKKAPCNYLKNGLECPHGDKCCWGHVCPGGARCFHLSKGKCWFKGVRKIKRHDGTFPYRDIVSGLAREWATGEYLTSRHITALLIYLLWDRLRLKASFYTLTSTIANIMSAPHAEEDDLAPTQTPGYKPGAEKTIEELARLDAEDESLARWKASLGIVPGATGDGNGPKLTVLSLELRSPTMPEGMKLSMDVTNPQASDILKKNPFNIKEGVNYNVRINFRVNHGIVSGLRYIQVVKRAGVRVDKMEQMIGSFRVGEAKQDFPEEESPSGMIARSGSYSVRSRVVDDDGQVYADWEWVFKLTKEW